MLQFMCAGHAAASRNCLARGIIGSLACPPPVAQLAFVLLLAGPCRQHCYGEPIAVLRFPFASAGSKDIAVGTPCAILVEDEENVGSFKDYQPDGAGAQQSSGQPEQKTEAPGGGAQALAYPGACCCASGRPVCPAHTAILTAVADTQASAPLSSSLPRTQSLPRTCAGVACCPL